MKVTTVYGKGKGITTVKVPHIGPRPRNEEVPFALQASKKGTIVTKK